MTPRCLTPAGVLLACAAVLLLRAAPARADEAYDPFAFFQREARLMSIKVNTVSRTESTVGKSPAAVFVITSEMIRRSGATAIPELLRLVPGMDVARITNNDWAISSRGFNDRFANKLLVQVDGRVVYNALFSGVYWDALDYPLEDIERIEVIRGPGASVWGANAVNGVINIITKTAAGTQGTLLTAGGGSAGLGFGTIRYGGKTRDGLFYRAYAKGFRSDKQFSADRDPNDAWNCDSAGARLDWKIGADDEATVDAGYLHSVAGHSDTRPQAAPPFSFLNIEDQVSTAGHVLMRWSRGLAGGSRWALRGYWDYYSRPAYGIQTGAKLNTYDLDFTHEFPLGDRQHIVYGLGYRYVDAHLKSSAGDGNFLLFFPDPYPQASLGTAFVSDQIALVEDKLSLTLGSKFEHNDFTGFEVQPTARLLFTPTPRQSFWAAVSRAVRTPNFVEDQIQVRIVPVVAPVFPQATGNKDFKSEELLAYELGHRAQIRDDLSTDLALFYNYYNRLRVGRSGAVKAGPAGTLIAPSVFDNGMDGHTYGAEAATTWQARPRWQLAGSYTLLKMVLRRSAGISASAEAAANQSPSHQASLRSSWNLPRDAEFDLTGRFVDHIRGFNPTGIGPTPNDIRAYAALDARLGWRPRPDLELSLAGQNLLADHHPEFGTNALVASPIVEIRRSVYGKITWRF